MDDLNSPEPLLPSITSLDGITDPVVKKALQAIKEALEVRLGQRPRASVYDKALTLRDMYRYNLASFTVNGQQIINPQPDNSMVSPVGGSGGEETPEPVVIDTSIPSALMGLVATGTKLAVLLEWTKGTTKGYTEIHRSGVNDIGTAVLIGTSDATLHGDIIGQTGVTFFYWIRFVSTANIVGPFNSLNGTTATTGQIGSNDLISVDGAKIIDATILNAKILTVDASKIRTGQLLATESIQVGESLTRLFIQGTGIIRSAGMLDYLNGSGFHLRALSGTAQFSVGNGTNYIGFDGNNIVIQTPNFQLTNSSLTFNGSGTFAGNLSAVNGTLANLRINAGGAINSGAFTGYAWPPAGGTGFHLGTEGLLLGNVNNNQYIQFTKFGEFYMGNGTTNLVSDAGGLRVNGPLIATGNVLNDAITRTSTVYTAASVTLTTAASQVQALGITTTGLKVLILCSVNCETAMNSNHFGHIFFDLLMDGGVIASTTGGRLKGAATGTTGIFEGSAGGAVSFTFSHTPGAGGHTYSVNARKTADGSLVATVSDRSLFAMEIKR